MGLGDAGHELYRVFGAAKVGGRRIAVVNSGSSQVRFFDTTGNFVGQVGRKGNGPGEFDNAFYLWPLTGDSLAVGDYPPWRYHVFSKEGVWSRTMRPAPTYGSPVVTIVLADGRAVLADRPRRSLTPEFVPQFITLVVHSPEGELEDTLGTYSRGRWGRLSHDQGGGGLYPLFEAPFRASGSGSRLIVGEGGNAEVSVFEGPGRLSLRAKVRWSLPHDRRVLPEHVAAERERLEAFYQALGPGALERARESLLHPARPVSDDFPAFQELLVDTEGQLWVQKYPRPGEPDFREWLVFDPGGRYRCTISIPPVDEVYEVGPDYVLAYARDEAGIEQVREYEIRWPQ
jgi:hypothetical protein